MIKLDAALLKLEGALDYTIDPRVRTLIDVAQQAIEAAKYLMKETQEVEQRFEVAYTDTHVPGSLQEGQVIACLGGYQRAA